MAITSKDQIVNNCSTVSNLAEKEICLNTVIAQWKELKFYIEGRLAGEFNPYRERLLQTRDSYRCSNQNICIIDGYAGNRTYINQELSKVDSIRTSLYNDLATADSQIIIANQQITALKSTPVYNNDVEALKAKQAQDLKNQQNKNILILVSIIAVVIIIVVSIVIFNRKKKQTS